MSGETQFGKCDICKKQTFVESKFYHYGFKCDCHSPEHFERVNYCKDCIPKKPPHTKVTLTDEQAQFIAKAVEFYQNNSIKHGRWQESRCLDDCFWVCSCCKFPSTAVAAPKLYKYCPNCGAKMDAQFGDSGL